MRRSYLASETDINLEMCNEWGNLKSSWSSYSRTFNFLIRIRTLLWHQKQGSSKNNVTLGGGSRILDKLFGFALIKTRKFRQESWLKMKGKKIENFSPRNIWTAQRYTNRIIPNCIQKSITILKFNFSSCKFL